MIKRKLISVVVPVYNESASIDELYKRTTKTMQSLTEYDYEIVFFDDGSDDGTRDIIRNYCSTDAHIKAVFYKGNFGYTKSIFYCVQQAKGDSAVILHADLQNPPEEIPKFVEKWENGCDVVLGVKNKSKENIFVYFIRTLYYLIMRLVFGMNLVKHATEFELFDKSFINILNKKEFFNPFLRAIISKYSKKCSTVYFVQDKREKGKSKFNLNKYYDFAICGVVNMSEKLPRKILLFSALATVICFAELVINYIPDVIKGYVTFISSGLVVRGIFFMCCVILAVSALILEYLNNLTNAKSSKDIIEEDERINY